MADNSQALALIGAIQAELEAQKDAAARARYKLGLLAELLEPAPPPVGPGPGDPVSGLPWPSGFGQCAEQIAALCKMRGRRAGAYAGWSAFQSAPANKQGWDWLRGGESDDPEQLGGIFAEEGAAHFHRVARDRDLLDPRAILIWIFPMTPMAAAWNNNRKAGSSWSNPGLWRRVTGEARDIWLGHYEIVGARQGVMLQRYRRDPARFRLVLGWEATGTWYPWSVGPDAAAFVSAWRLAVDAMRKGLARTYPGAEDQVTFEFRFAGNQTLEVPWQQVWPGKDHAGILGVSLHPDVDSWGIDANWQAEMRGDGSPRKIGFLNALELARAEGVKVGVDEWGVRLGGTDKRHPPDPFPGASIARVGQLLRENAAMIAHECFLWSSNYNLLGSSQREQAGREAYLAAFGKEAA